MLHAPPKCRYTAIIYSTRRQQKALIMSSSLAVLLLLLGGAWLLVQAVRSKKSPKSLPPGPPGLPIIGHLHLLSSRPYRDLQRLARAYGPVMYLRLGTVPTVVISTPAAAQELFKSHDLAISGRPRMQSSDFLTYESKGMGPSQYGPYWRGIRKLLTTELLSNQKVESFAPMRREEVALLVASLKDAAGSRAVVDVTAKVSYLIMDMACRMVLGSKGATGKDVEEVRGIRWIIQDGARLLATFNIADFIPFVGPLDLQGLKRRMRGVKEATDRFLDKIIDGRLQAVAEGQPSSDVADILVSYMVSRADGEEFNFDRNNVKALIMELIASTVEPIVTTIEWAFSELLRHPDMMRKAQEELEGIVGMDRMVEETDLNKLHYLEMVLKESMRLHTPLPILIPYKAMEDCTLNGFDISRDSEIIINAWAIGRDSVAWPEPERFYPERFLDSKVDVKGHDFELIPFGFGRRGCPGVQLGLTVVRSVLAQLVHCFNWELPDGVSADELDMEEVFSITAPRAKHLLAIPSCRLQ